MSKDVLKYGTLQAFILEKVSERDNLVHREKHWIEQKDALSNGYNKQPSGRSGKWLNTYS